jgi:uncharacterized membrane protein
MLFEFGSCDPFIPSRARLLSKIFIGIGLCNVNRIINNYRILQQSGAIVEEVKQVILYNFTHKTTHILPTKVSTLIYLKKHLI